MRNRGAFVGFIALALLAPGKLFAYEYAVPDDLADGWEPASLAQAGVDAAPLQEMFERIERSEYANIRSVLIVKNGRLIVEEYFPRPADARERAFRRVQPVEITSATKSVTSLLIGSD